MWTIIGDDPKSGLPVKVSFDGELNANAAISRLMQAYVDDWEFVGVTPAGPVLKADLSDETAAFLVASAVLSRVELVAGNEPPLPGMPDIAANAAQ